ncbi:glycosyltransferase [Spirosoma sp. SC4-14]|uniref:glycosyltransferase n=1 Tax=Spirosoma sp. SC4-14 TaxID=3128900 RepID=UPI0030D4FF17
MKPKVLIFHPALAPYRIDQFNNLQRLFNVHLVFVFDNVWNHRFDQKKLLSQLNCEYSFLLVGPRYKGRVFRFGILNTINRFKPDLIISYEYSIITFYLILLRKLKLVKTPLASTIDDSIDICKNIQSKIRSLSRLFSLNNLDYLIVLSREVAEYYQNTFSFPSSRIITSPILQDENRIKAKKYELEVMAKVYQDKYELNNKKVLLFVGRLIKEKAVFNFISTIKQLLIKNNDLSVVIVGDGEEYECIQDYIRSFNLEQKVILPGRYESVELYAWYLTASAFFLPSTFEPFGAVVNEALIFGLPVFCSKYAGASSLINHNTGITYDPLDKIETVERLDLFLEQVRIVSNIDINLHQSLMELSENNFESEWQKFFN